MKNRVSLKIAMLFTAVFLVMIFFPVKVFAENEYTVTEMTTEGEVISDVNVRMGPATSYDILGTVREKDIVAISGRSSDGWYRIDYQGQTGFVYGEYISVIEKAPEETPAAVQQPSPNSAKRDFGPFRLAAIFVIIIVIIIMIVLTIRSFIRGSRDENEEDEEDDGEDGESDGDDLVKPEETSEKKESKKSGGTTEAVKTIVIREEDYQLHIDPKYFEDEPLSQPEYVTDYLKKIESENTQPSKPLAKKENADDLTRAMKKLEELQEEIERLKRNQ